MHEEGKDVKDTSAEYETGVSVGRAIATVIVGCILALMITVTLKLMKWIWLL